MLKSEQIQAEIDNKNAAIDAEAQNGQQTNHDNIIGWRADIVTLTDQKNEALAEEAKQQAQIDREQAQEEEVQAITLPYDFNDILSEPDHPVTAANEMIIEVVRDVKRQANIEKNQAVDEVKAEYSEKLRLLQSDFDGQKDTIFELNQNLTELKDDYDNLELQRNHLYSQNEASHQKASQAITDRDDAYTKRDNAFRDLQEAREEIERLQKKLENLPVSKLMEISSSDKLAQMVKDSLAEKVNRGLARWNVTPLDLPEIVAIQNVSAEKAQEESFQEDHQVSSEASEADTSGDRDGAIPQNLGESPAKAEETLTLESLKAEIDALKSAHGERLDRLDKQANLPAVA